jgi:hypothetical protein
MTTALRQALLLAFSVSFALPVCLAAGASCHNKNASRRHEPGAANLDKTGSTTLTGATWITTDAAVDRLVSARCAHELTCSDVGSDDDASTAGACVADLRESVGSELLESCPNGVDGRSLDDCLDAIRAESCTHRWGTLSHVPTCTAGDLCIKGGSR